MTLLDPPKREMKADNSYANSEPRVALALIGASSRIPVAKYLRCCGSLRLKHRLHVVIFNAAGVGGARGGSPILYR